jgi:diguanylate cyclase (GGDEF)-like protein
VEDNIDVGNTLALALQALNADWTVDLARCLVDGIEMLKSSETGYTAAIVDLGLPDAVEGEAPLKIQEISPLLPIVVLTGQKSDAAAADLIQGGIQDYVVKGHASPSQVALTVKSAIQRQALQNSLESAALTDPVTGALNRRGLETAFERCIGAANRSKGNIGLILCDINKFKSINDSFGHPAGDAVIRTVVDGFESHSRPADLVARLGGDEFVVVINRVYTKQQVVAAAERLISIIPKACEYRDNLIEFSASFGVSIYPDHGSTLDKLIAVADQAMYKVKGSKHILFVA